MLFQMHFNIVEKYVWVLDLVYDYDDVYGRHDWKT